MNLFQFSRNLCSCGTINFHVAWECGARSVFKSIPNPIKSWSLSKSVFACKRDSNAWWISSPTLSEARWSVDIAVGVGNGRRGNVLRGKIRQGVGFLRFPGHSHRSRWIVHKTRIEYRSSGMQPIFEAQEPKGTPAYTQQLYLSVSQTGSHLC